MCAWQNLLRRIAAVKHYHCLFKVVKPQKEQQYAYYSTTGLLRSNIFRLLSGSCLVDGSVVLRNSFSIFMMLRLFWLVGKILIRHHVWLWVICWSFCIRLVRVVTTAATREMWVLQETQQNLPFAARKLLTETEQQDCAVSSNMGSIPRHLHCHPCQHRPHQCWMKQKHAGSVQC